MISKIPRVHIRLAGRGRVVDRSIGCAPEVVFIGFSLKGGYHPMDEKRYLELRLKITTTGQLAASEVRELERFEGELIKKLTPEERVQKFEAACKWFGVKPSQILGNKENVP